MEINYLFTEITKKSIIPASSINLIETTALAVVFTPLCGAQFAPNNGIQ